MMKNRLTVAQLSDIHIGADSDFVQGINVRENFRSALYSPSVQGADLIMLSGDLTDDGSIDGYEFVKREMEKCGKPWRFILGNHDDHDNCFKVFKKDTECPFADTYDYTFEFGGHYFVCLDSANGNINENQRLWLKKQVEVDQEAILFTHYPPCICGHKFMDSRYAMNDLENVQKLLASFKNLKNIFCGHYHSEFNIELPSGQKVYVAPPTQMQIDPEQQDFTLVTTKPAWQIISFKEDGPSVEVFAL